MNIEITGETEQLIRAAIATGQYASAEEFIDQRRKWYEDCTSHPHLPKPKSIELDAVAAAQGMGPIQAFRDLEADFLPPGESIDEFIKDIRALRDADEPRTR